VSGRGYYLGAPAGALDQGRHVLGAGEHVVVRSGDGRTPQKVTDLLQMLVEVVVDLVPHRCPEDVRPATVHDANLSLHRGSCPAGTKSGDDRTFPAASTLRILPHVLLQ